MERSEKSIKSTLVTASSTEQTTIKQSQEKKSVIEKSIFLAQKKILIFLLSFF
jgi:hypothetical protein